MERTLFSCVLRGSGRLEGWGRVPFVAGGSHKPGVWDGLKAEAVYLLFECYRGGAEGLDAGCGGGHFGEVFVAEGVDGVEAGAGLVCGDGLL